MYVDMIGFSFFNLYKENPVIFPSCMKKCFTYDKSSLITQQKYTTYLK